VSERKTTTKEREQGKRDQLPQAWRHILMLPCVKRAQRYKRPDPPLAGGRSGTCHSALASARRDRQTPTKKLSGFCRPPGWCFSLWTEERRAAGGVVSATLSLFSIRGARTPSRFASVGGGFSRARCVMSVQSRHWLDYDPVALVVLVVGMSAVALLALSL
jgi:hypothetical protein